MNRLKQSFAHALRGISHVLKTEPNFKIHCFASILMILIGFLLGFSALKWVLLAIAISLVVVTEIVNTAIEYSWDHLEPNHHPVVGIIKDIMAGAVLINSFVAVIIGIAIIFFI